MALSAETWGKFFIATICCEALWSFSYGFALLVFDPGLRELFEIPIWLAINFIGVFFLAFALEYTGRGTILRSKLVAGIVALQTGHTLVVATNPLHHIAWSNYHIDAVAGVATVAYTHQPWLFLNATGFILMIATASFLLVDTVISYGPLYRTQAAAIAVSPIFPGLPFLLWLVQVGNTPPLNFTPLVFPIHLAFDMYAFFSRDMFEMVPAARRVADRSAIDHLGSPVAIIDDNERVIEVNQKGASVLGVDPDAALSQRLSEVCPDIDLDEDGETVSQLVDGRRRVYAVTVSSLQNSSGTAIGDTIVLQDVTAERQREQRLSVLNRVLRHNLRNDLNVVDGYVGIAAERVDDEEVRELLQTAKDETDDLLELGAKARSIERAMERGSETHTSVSVRNVLADVRDDLAAAYPDAAIDIDVRADAEIRADEQLLDQILRNLMENALEHTDEGAAAVEVALVDDAEAGSLTVAIQDEGPGIPEDELAVLGTGTETALEHGSGLGLWLVKWGMDLLGGTVTFETSEGGTTVELEFPAQTTDEADGDDRSSE